MNDNQINTNFNKYFNCCLEFRFDMFTEVYRYDCTFLLGNQMNTQINRNLKNLTTVFDI